MGFSRYCKCILMNLHISYEIDLDFWKKRMKRLCQSQRRMLWPGIWLQPFYDGKVAWNFIFPKSVFPNRFLFPATSRKRIEQLSLPESENYPFNTHMIKSFISCYRSPLLFCPCLRAGSKVLFEKVQDWYYVRQKICWRYCNRVEVIITHHTLHIMADDCIWTVCWTLCGGGSWETECCNPRGKILVFKPFSASRCRLDRAWAMLAGEGHD